jgi:hypothetical protein
MAPPLTGKSLILHPQQKTRSQSGAASMAEAGELNPLLPATERFVDLLERLKLETIVTVFFECSDVELLNA